MIRFLRVLSFILGSILIAVPPLLILIFSYQVGEPPTDINQFIHLFKPFLFGLFLGSGLFLAGLPNLVVGVKSPIIRWPVGLLLLFSFATLLLIGFSGTVTQKISPVILVVQVIVFYMFVWPAKVFKKPKC